MICKEVKVQDLLICAQMYKLPCLSFLLLPTLNLRRLYEPICLFASDTPLKTFRLSASGPLAALSTSALPAGSLFGLSLFGPFHGTTRFLLLEGLGTYGLALHHLLVGHCMHCLRHRLIVRVHLLVGPPSGSQDTTTDSIPGVFLDCLHFRCALSLLSISQCRLISLLLLIFVDALKDTVHLLLEEKLEFFDHELIDGASLDKVRDKAFNCVAFIHNDALDSKVGNVDINIQLCFAFIGLRCNVALSLIVCVAARR